MSAPGLLCPACRTDLVMTERQNIEIDYCPKCRGVWLDRGELDKIIERSAAQPVSQAVPQNAAPPPPQAYPGYGGEGGERGRYGKPYRRKSWLEEIFD
jgi:Zn-finger nucleic acid-binding protein